MRTLIVVTSLAMALTPALAQKTDRLSDADRPKVVRTIPLAVDPIHTLEERWGPVMRAMLDEQLARHGATRKNAPTGLPEAVGIVPVPGNRLRHDPITRQVSIRKPDQATCLRHRLRTVWAGQSWRCRK